MAIILTPSFTPPAMTTFAAMAPDVSAFLPGCPNLVIERTMRKMAVDLCQRAKVWRMDAVPVSLIAGTYRYTLAAPGGYAEVIDIDSAYTIDSDGAKVNLEWKPQETLRQWYPAWPEDSPGQPAYYAKREPSDILLAPAPQATADLYATVIVRPVADATGVESWLYHEFARVLFHGTLHELMLMPERSWTDEKTGAYHGKQWTYLLNNAKTRVSRDFNTGSQAVQMRPFA